MEGMAGFSKCGNLFGNLVNTNTGMSVAQWSSGSNRQIEGCITDDFNHLTIR